MTQIHLVEVSLTKTGLNGPEDKGEALTKVVSVERKSSEQIY